MGTDYPLRGGERLRAATIARVVSQLPLSSEQRIVLVDLERLGVPIIDIWHGSHVRIEGDAGRFYDRWRRLGADPRASSHYREVRVQQYEIRFGRSGFLFGKDGGGNTWCQMERTAKGASPLAHFSDFLTYRMSGENVGPLGLSPHTEKNGALRVRGEGP